MLCRGRIARIVQRRIPLLPSSLGIRVVEYELIGHYGTENRGSNIALRLPELAHDLNNSLAVVIGACDLITSDPEASATVKRHASNIRAAGQRSAQLVQQLSLWERS